MNPVRIADLSQNRGFIRARIVCKSNLITCRNGTKQLQLHLMDASGTIKALAYGTDAIHLYNILEYNKTYDINQFRTLQANKEYTKLDHNYELRLSSSTQIRAYTNETSDVPDIEYNFVTIDKILQMRANTKVDCIAVCRIVGSLKTGKRANGNGDYQKRNLYLVDNSKAVIALTLWSDAARNFVGKAPFIIVIRRATINEYEVEKSLSTSNDSSLEVNPSLFPQSCNLNPCSDFKWHDSLFCRQQPYALVEGYFKFKGVIYCIDCKDLYYEACNICQRKVFKYSTGDLYRCDKCNIESSNLEYKLLLKMFIGESFMNVKVTGFSDFVEHFIGQSPENIVRTLENDPTSAEEIFKPIYYKTYIFYAYFKQESYEGEMKLKANILSAVPINTRKYNKYLIENLKKYIPIEK